MKWSWPIARFAGIDVKIHATFLIILVLGAMLLVWSLSMGGMALAWRLWAMTWVRVLFGLAQAGCYPNLSKVVDLPAPKTAAPGPEGRERKSRRPVRTA